VYFNLNCNIFKLFMFMSLQVDVLWTNKPTELLVAIMQDTEENNEYLLHHKTCHTLKSWRGKVIMTSYFIKK